MRLSWPHGGTHPHAHRNAAYFIMSARIVALLLLVALASVAPPATGWIVSRLPRHRQQWGSPSTPPLAPHSVGGFEYDVAVDGSRPLGLRLSTALAVMGFDRSDDHVPLEIEAAGVVCIDDVLVAVNGVQLTGLGMSKVSHAVSYVGGSPPGFASHLSPSWAGTTVAVTTTVVYSGRAVRHTMLLSLCELCCGRRKWRGGAARHSSPVVRNGGGRKRRERFLCVVCER